jgi:hypothetical protein
MDETARLILMDEPEIRFTDFAISLREYHKDASVVDCKVIYRKYKGWGWDGLGRTQPTHDIETGERLKNG